MKVMQLWTVLLSLPFAAAIWPLPSEYTSGTSDLWITPEVKVTYNPTFSNAKSYSFNYQTSQQPIGASDNSSSSIVHTAVQSMYTTLFNQSFIPWRFYPRGASFEPTYTGSSTTIPSIVLTQTKADPPSLVNAPVGTINESYTVSVPKNGAVTITAPSALGISHGLTTLTQLFFQSTSGLVYTSLAPVSITDSPRFAHRGLNLDVSRSYYPVSDIVRTIDGLSFNKFNRLHLHITDAQSWPLVIPSLPSLSTKGAYPPGQVYTPADLSHIQSYGALRGVQVYLEIDMPGHTSSIYYSKPSLITAFNQQPDWQTYAAEPPSGSLRLNDTSVDSFLSTLFGDLLPRTSPWSPLFHTGGDEVNFNTFLLDPSVRSSDPSVIKPLLQSFINKAHSHVRAAGLTPLVWEEMLLSYNLSLPTDVIIQTWQSDAAVLETVQKGHRALAGNYNYWYLDCGKGQWLDFTPGAESTAFYPYLDYCDPRKNWRIIYSYDPVRGVPESLQHLVLGGEAHMWSEQTDPVNLDTSLWPRLSAAGEVLWRGQPGGGLNLSQTEASPRLADMRERLVARGIRAEPIQMAFCTMYEGSCQI